MSQVPAVKCGMLNLAQLINDFCKDNNQSAFRSFYQQQSKQLWKFLIARGSSEDDAYDILSESFLRFIKVVCDDPSQPKALLYRIAINYQIDLYRRQQRSPVAANNEVVDHAEDTLGSSLENQLDTIQLLKNLKESEQNMLLMRYWVGMTHKEVAHALELPEGTVRRKSAELLTKLKDQNE